MNFTTLLLLFFSPIFAHFLFFLSENFNFFPKKSAQNKIIFFLLISAGFIFVLTAYQQHRSLSLNATLFSFSILVLVLVSHIYFHIFNMSETARRIRLLLSIEAGEYFENYDEVVQLRLRISRLKQLKAIRQEKELFYLEPGILSFAATQLQKFARILLPKPKSFNSI